jgi:hypothetical protein
MNYNDLSINQILELAGGDLDEMQLARRISQRLVLDVRRRAMALNESETQQLANLAEVIDRELGGAR